MSAWNRPQRLILQRNALRRAAVNGLLNQVLRASGLHDDLCIVRPVVHLEHIGANLHAGSARYALVRIDYDLLCHHFLLLVIEDDLVGVFIASS